MTNEKWFKEMAGFLDGTGWVVDRAITAQDNSNLTADVRHARTGLSMALKFSADVLWSPELRKAEVLRLISEWDTLDIKRPSDP